MPGYFEVPVVQSAGGYAMRQKLGAGRVNSTATLVGPIGTFAMYTTRHSFCSPQSMFCMRSLCLGVTFSAKAINAPCAFTTNVCALSENCGPSFGGLLPTTRTVNLIRRLQLSLRQGLLVQRR